MLHLYFILRGTEGKEEEEKKKKKKKAPASAQSLFLKLEWAQWTSRTLHGAVTHTHSTVKG